PCSSPRASLFPYTTLFRSLILLSVLKGSVCFATDLSRHVTVPVNFDYVAVSSYGAQTQSSGHVQLLKDLTMDVAGRDVLMVEDIDRKSTRLNSSHQIISYA